MYLIIEVKMVDWPGNARSKINTIRFIRNALGWGLKECKEFYEAEIARRVKAELMVTPDQYGRLIATKTFEDSGEIASIIPLKIIKDIYVDIRDKK